MSSYDRLSTSENGLPPSSSLLSISHSLPNQTCSDGQVMVSPLARCLMLLVAAGWTGAAADNLAFPAGFLLGCATASYQIEGAWNVSGMPRLMTLQ